MAPTAEEAALLRELHAGLAVAKSQQTEINRRLGNIESLLASMPDEDRIKNAENDIADLQDWTTWAVRLVAGSILMGVVIAIGKLMGIQLPS